MFKGYQGATATVTATAAGGGGDRPCNLSVSASSNSSSANSSPPESPTEPASRAVFSTKNVLLEFDERFVTLFPVAKVGMTWHQLLASVSCRIRANLYSERPAGAKPRAPQEVVFERNGAKCWVRYSAELLEDGNVVALCSDVTEAKSKILARRLKAQRNSSGSGGSESGRNHSLLPHVTCSSRRASTGSVLCAPIVEGNEDCEDVAAMTEPALGRRSDGLDALCISTWSHPTPEEVGGDDVSCASTVNGSNSGVGGDNSELRSSQRNTATNSPDHGPIIHHEFTSFCKQLTPAIQRESTAVAPAN